MIDLNNVKNALQLNSIKKNEMYHYFDSILKQSDTTNHEKILSILEAITDHINTSIMNLEDPQPDQSGKKKAIFRRIG